MKSHTRLVGATHVTLIAPPPVWPHCQRCGHRFFVARRDTVLCASCRQVEFFENQMAEQGIDLAELAEDEFLRWVGHGKDRRLIIEKEGEAGEAVAA